MSTFGIKKNIVPKLLAHYRKEFFNRDGFLLFSDYYEVTFNQNEFSFFRLS